MPHPDHEPNQFLGWTVEVVENMNVDLGPMTFSRSRQGFGASPMMRDLQTGWQPTTFSWRLVRYEPGSDWCACMGPTTPAEERANLCRCAWERLYGTWKWERILSR